MKTQIMSTALLAAALLSVSPGFAQQTAEDLYQAGLYQEEVQGNLENAIDLYERILADHSDKRPVAARALMHVGLCHEKLGRVGAERAYEKLIAEYADQTEVAARARSRLAAIRRAAREAGDGLAAISTRRIQKWIYGEAMPLAVTPDGTRLIYQDTWFGNLAIRELANGESWDLTRDSSFSVWVAASSPDGRAVSFVRGTPTGVTLNLINVDGSNPRVLHREAGCTPYRHEWTSDGEEIIAVIECDGRQRLTRISLQSGAAQLVREIESPELQGISISPDDGYVAYALPVREESGNHDIRITAADASTDEYLVRHPADDRLLGWLPGTDDVLFLSDRAGATDLWSVKVAEGTPQGPPRLIRRDMGDVYAIGFTDAGGLVYGNYTRWFSTGVAPVDLTTGRIFMESREEILGSVLSPAWSPDGGSLAFVIEQKWPVSMGGPYKRPLHVRHLASGVERELASHIQARNPKWSPDGRFIIMCGRDVTEERETYRGGLYLIDVESGEATEVLDLVPETNTAYWSDLGADFSKDGSAIIYSLYDNNRTEGRLVWRDLQSGEERELFRDPALTSRLFAVSPDGHRLAFGLKSTPAGYNSSIHSGGRLMIMDLDDGTVRELHEIRENGRVWSLQWTPDGEYLLYTKRTEDHDTAVWRVSVSGGSAEKLWTFDEDHYDAYINLSPDGQRAAYTTYHQEFEVWMMENLVAALTEKP